MERKIMRELLDWKQNDKDRKPLLLYGARQTGKTYILQKFGESSYNDFLYINLENDNRAREIFADDLRPEKIIFSLELLYKKKIKAGQTLLILDEIQSCDRALTSLKYFCELAPEQHVVAAGSLLGVAVNRSNYSFPVGKVKILTLYPMDFEEFLWVENEQALAELIRAHYHTLEAIPVAIHEKLLALYRLYLVVGGMPAAVAAYAAEKSLATVAEIHGGILDSYVADMAKYANATETVRIRACYNSLPAQLAKENKKFQYRVVQHGGRANTFAGAIDWLEASGVALCCKKLTGALLPLAAYEDAASFKLYFSDVGLLVSKAGIPRELVLSDVANIFMGAVTENYLAQALKAAGQKLYYWTSNQTAEIDFVLQSSQGIVPVEVKKGTKVRSRSLEVFVKSNAYDYAMRFSARNFGKEDRLKSVPLYAAFCLEKY